MLFSTEEVQTKALNEVTFEIGKGEFVAIMGSSIPLSFSLAAVLPRWDTYCVYSGTEGVDTSYT